MNQDLLRAKSSLPSMFDALKSFHKERKLTLIRWEDKEVAESRALHKLNLGRLGKGILGGGEA